MDMLTTTTTAGLKNGLFDNILLVDSNGVSYHIVGAKKLHGVGPFWGFNIFLNQRIRVEPVFDGEPAEMSLDEVRKRIFSSFKSKHGWETRGDIVELKKAINSAANFSELIEALRDPGVGKAALAT
ncbi:hypothetical protein [Methylococcus sp. EFPC2]|uniref:hypothetical protein n=1 Tax=Methylococcus sp. EFPC2 TaxID=2812648 RepID=UPI00196717B2|nr:hypothetical protein [Methylococcus sp. EFPC2]QSA95833.1 hypothetical protein JWZ97_11335 [Methylococcus sp. EFPC2]